MQAQEAD